MAVLSATPDHKSIVPISYDGKYYIRSGSTVMELRGNDLANFLMKKLGKTWDDFIEERASLDDLNPDTIEKFKELAEDRVPSIARERSHKIILEKLNLMEKGSPKRAAILLFGKNPQRFYTQAFLKIGKFLNETDIVSSDIVEGNLQIGITGKGTSYILKTPQSRQAGKQTNKRSE